MRYCIIELCRTFFWALRKLVHLAVCHLGRKPPKGSKPTRSQELRLEGLFPKLKAWSVTGPETGPWWWPRSYNCIAWSVGVTDKWLQPDDWTVEGFDEFYASYGWIQSESGKRTYGKRKTALYAENCDPTACTHASVETHDCQWDESKAGEMERIMHKRHELEGGFYGDVIRYYERPDDNANLVIRG